MKTKVPPPDPAVGRAQEGMTRIAAQAEARAAENDRYYRENFAPRYLEQMDAQLELSRDEAARQKELSDYSLGLSKKYDQRYWDTTAKQQDAFYKIVDDYDSSGRQERQAASAVADVEQGLGAARQSLTRNAQRLGLNLGSGEFMSSLADMEFDGGLARAGAANMAREAARREGLNLRATAAGLGGNLSGTASGYLGQSGGFGMGAIGAMGSGMGAIGAAQGGANQNNAMWNGTMGVATSNLHGAGSLGMQLTQMRYDANKANAMGFNQVLGAGLGMATGGTKPWILGP